MAETEFHATEEESQKFMLQEQLKKLHELRAKRLEAEVYYKNLNAELYAELEIKRKAKIENQARVKYLIEKRERLAEQNRKTREERVETMRCHHMMETEAKKHGFKDANTYADYLESCRELHQNLTKELNGLQIKSEQKKKDLVELQSDLKSQRLKRQNHLTELKAQIKATKEEKSQLLELWQKIQEEQREEIVQETKLRAIINMLYVKIPMRWKRKVDTSDTMKQLLAVLEFQENVEDFKSKAQHGNDYKTTPKTIVAGAEMSHKNPEEIKEVNVKPHHLPPLPKENKKKKAKKKKENQGTN